MLLSLFLSLALVSISEQYQILRVSSKLTMSISLMQPTYRVKNLSQSKNFYSKCLGMRIFSEDTNCARLGYTEHEGIELIEMSPTEQLKLGDVRLVSYSYQYFMSLKLFENSRF